MRCMSMNCQQQPLVGSAPPPRPVAAPLPSPAFDRWLQDELARRYDDALAEPVPDELLRLLHTTN